MFYRAIGIMSGSSLDGLDIAFVEFQEQGGKWSFEIREAACYAYEEEWEERLRDAPALSARDYLLLHSAYGRYIGERVNRFIREKGLSYQVMLIASHGHTSFHLPASGMTAQLGDGSAIAAETGLPVVGDLRAMDVALGGQGAPIVPVGEKLLLGDHPLFLNIGGIANLSCNADPYIAFDICPANRVLNLLAQDAGMDFDDGGQLAASGKVDTALLETLNGQEYYRRPWPKSLANEFGTGFIYPLIKNSGLSVPDALRTYTEHIALQVKEAVREAAPSSLAPGSRMLCTGGGAFNRFLVQRIREELSGIPVTVEVPDPLLVNYKEALIMAFIGVLRWRQEPNALASVTGSRRNSCGGALWSGQND